MKKFFLTAVIFLLITETAFALPRTLWEKIDTEKLSSSISHEHILRFTPEGWFNINAIKVKITDPLNQVKVLRSSGGISTRESVKDMVEKSGAIAGINASFFNSNSTVIGTIIENGEIISTSNLKDDVPSLALGSDLKPFLTTTELYVDINDVSQNFSLMKVPVNRFGYGGDNPISILTKDFGAESIGSAKNKDIIEVLVIDGAVHDIRTGGAPFPIPQNGYVLSVIKGSLGYRSVDRIQIGDNLSLIYPDESFRNIKLSVPGGAVILKNGVVVNEGLDIKGNQPRSAVGYSSDGETLMLVTADGRNTSYFGVSQKTMGEIMLSLGCGNALNLDGGGSTNLAVHKKGEDKTKIVNKPSERNRKVITSIGIMTDSVPVGEVENLKMELSDSHCFLLNGTTVKLNAKDFHQNPVELNPGEVQLSVSGVEGEFKTGEGIKFIPRSAGRGVITAVARGLKAEKEIFVAEKAVDLSSNTDALYLEPGEITNLPVFTATDGNGISGVVSDIGLSVYGGVGEIMGDQFVAQSTPGSGYICAVFAGGVENVPVFVGSEKRPLLDFNDKKRQTLTTAPKETAGALGENGGRLTLSYDFSKSSATRACYLNFDEKSATPIPKGAISLGMTVTGDGNGTWLRGVVNDGNKNYTIDFARNLDTSDTVVTRAMLPETENPLKLVRIYAVEDRPMSKYKGSVTISNLTANYPLPLKKIEDLPKDIPPKDPKEGAALEGALISVVNEPYTYDNNKADTSALMKNANGQTLISLNGFSKSDISGKRAVDGKLFSYNYNDNAAVLTLSAVKGSIWTTASPQWPAIFELKNADRKNILVTLDKPVAKIVDKLEADLFRRQMAELVETGKNVVVVQKSTKNAKYIKNGVRYLEVYENSIRKPSDIPRQTILNLKFSPDDFSYSYFLPFAKK